MSLPVHGSSSLQVQGLLEAAADGLLAEDVLAAEGIVAAASELAAENVMAIEGHDVLAVGGLSGRLAFSFKAMGPQSLHVSDFACCSDSRADMPPAAAGAADNLGVSLCFLCTNCVTTTYSKCNKAQLQTHIST